MDQLFAIVQRECSTAVWSRAVQLSRNSELKGRRTVHEELELRVLTKAGMASPLVVLSPEQGDWSCECPSDEPVCIHVATAMIYIQNALVAGDEIPGLKAPSANIAYRISRTDGFLVLERFVARGLDLTPLSARLTAVKRQDAADDIAISQADIAVDLELRSLNDGRIPGPIMERLLGALAECKNVQLDGAPVVIGEAVPLISARVEDHPEGFLLIADQDPAVHEVFANGAVLHAGVLRPIGHIDFSNREVDELRKGKVYTFGEVADLVGRALPALQERIPVRVLSRVLPSATPMQPRLAFNLSYDAECLALLPTMVYGDPPAARVDGGRLRYLGGALPLRDERAEQRLVDELKQKLDIEIGKVRRFTGLEALHAAKTASEWKNVYLEGNGLNACFMAPELEPHMEIGDSDFELTFLSPDSSAPRHATAQTVLSCWERGEPVVPLLEGGWAPLPEALLQRCGHLLMDLLEAKAQNQKLPACSAPDLARLCDELGHPCPPDIARLRTLADDFKGISLAALPGDLTATLRGYQVEGVNWLAFLSNAGLGALLADEMGLGKTLQALCVLKPPCLLVAPASVLPNWVKEIQRFRPGLKYHVYHGAGRGLDVNADVTLTTYAIMRLDNEILAKRAWDTVILDEAQNIKNADSQVAKAAFALQARFRITLSGTPVENRLEELWSQLHFLNRGLLGGKYEFQERYAKPIAAGDNGAAERLRQRIRPFLLRRLKRDVAAELPPRTDVVLYCTLSDREREIYDAIYAASRKEVVAALRAGGSVLAALEALLRLRQACCHPGLIPGQTAGTSSKIDLLVETLDKAIAEGHKALVFSQWTSFLDLIEPHLNRVSVPYVRLDGSTRDRGQVVDRFQNDASLPVMLVSLRAGGTGINLTAADNIFLLDPWWNPAVEDQAADRTHRIGQHRPVLVHRLVAEATVEERMLELQERKRALARAAVDAGPQQGGLTREDLIALLG
jgi:superfamily II DNA or RNA helicase